jgi:hypothetical protein
MIFKAQHCQISLHVFCSNQKKKKKKKKTNINKKKQTNKQTNKKKKKNPVVKTRGDAVFDPSTYLPFAPPLQ